MTNSDSKIEDLGLFLLHSYFGARLKTDLSKSESSEAIIRYQNLQKKEILTEIIEMSKSSPRLFEALLDVLLTDEMIPFLANFTPSDDPHVYAVVVTAQALLKDFDAAIVTVRDLRKESFSFEGLDNFSKCSLLLSGTRLSRPALAMGIIMAIPAVRRGKFRP